MGLSRRSIINALATEKSPGSSKVEEKTIFPASICSRMGSGYPIMFNHLSARNLVDIVDKKIRDLSEVFEHCYNKKNKTVKMHCYDKNAFFAILFSEGGLVDARILSAQSGFFLKKQISIMLNYEDIRNQINNDEPTEVEISVLINDDNERTLFQNPDPTQIFYFGNPDTAELINAGLREHSDIVRNEKGIELHSVDIEEAKENGVDPIKKANSLYSDKDIMFVLLDYSVMENDDIKKIFNSIREKDPDMPIYLLYTENKMLHDDEYDNFVCKGVAGKVGIEDIRIRAFIDWLNDTANDSYLQRKAEEFARKSRVLTFETSTPKVEKSKVSIQIMNFSTTTAIHAEDAATMLANHERPTDKFKDIIGISDARETLERCAKFLKNPREYISKDIPQPKGVLLYGPPGTGKTMLARALAAESDAAFFNVNASEFMSKWVGSGPENIRKLFRSARRYTPAVIFIDEIETIGKIRGNNDSDNSASTLTTLLTEMDGFTVNTRRPVLVVAATNYEIEKSEEGLGVLDPALVRRFDETIRVGLPTREDRYEYLTKMLEKCRNYIKTDGNDEMVKTIATLSLGLSLADLENVIKYARVIADGNKITAEILNDAYETSKYGKERLKDKESIKRTARHEVGHAIIYYSTGTTPAYLTIVSRGNHGGFMMPDYNETKGNYTRKELLSVIRTSLGGRAAEIVYYGEHDGLSTGASNDLKKATNIAYNIVSTYGMDDVFGLISHTPGLLSPAKHNYIPPLVTALAPEIASRVRTILDNELNEAVKIIKDNKEMCDELIEKLVDKEKMTKEDIEEILGKPKISTL